MYFLLEGSHLNRRGISICLLLICCLFVLTSCMKKSIQSQEVKPLSSTEKFVINHLINEDGLLRTNLTDQKNVYLSESAGLWLAYLYEKGDQERFHQQVKVIKDHFLKNGLLAWKIDGEKQATVNALIDDERIAGILLKAGDKWHSAAYTKLGKTISQSLVKDGMQDGTFVDYVDVDTYKKANVLTLSYIMPQSLKEMKKHDVLTEEQYQKQLSILSKAPLSKNDTYPKAYQIDNQTYVYDDDLHLVDQLYVAYHQASVGQNTQTFKKWLIKIYRREHKLYGRYTASTEKPSVQYESPAVYALATRYMLKAGDFKLAQEFYGKMNEMKINKKSGYYDAKTKETHAFDNLSPLLAEREMAHATKK